MKYTCINIQGNLISEEILQKIEQANADGQSAKDFGLEPHANLRSEIEYAWSRIKLDWNYFSERSNQLPANDPYGTTLTRRWMEGFFDSLGFSLSRKRTALQGDNNQLYAISSTAENLDDIPVHVVGFIDSSNSEKNTLDIKSSGGTSRLSPHATVQEYLNVTEYVYGIAANGLYLRLIRDSGRLVKLTYVEFDLKRMLDEDKYSEFTLLYRLLHASRFPTNRQEADQSLLEKYYRDSIETGNRIRDGLSYAVKESLIALGKGFLQHEANTALRQKLQNGSLSAKDFYRQLLRLIYRLLFLMVTEERNLVYDPDDKNEDLLRKKRIYLQFYSIARLRKLSENRYLFERQFHDLWQALVNTFQLFEAHGKGKKLGIQPLDGDLFSETAVSDIETSLISNELLLECIRNLNEFTDDNKNLVPINYRSLDVEELGSVYEGLLELHPVIENIEASNPAHINFTFHEGTERKTTGSYYTRPDLVNELIKSALIPVIEERLKENVGNKEARSKSLLSLKVCDAAAGSGHMLLAAARTIAWYLARVQSDEDNPSLPIFRSCLREVIQHCVYGVDMNPDAVELCKLALWLESHNSGKPLSFLDHKIRCGNSLVGVTELSVLNKGIPDKAFNPVTGDDKEVCKELKKANAAFNKTRQINLFDQQAPEIETHEFSAEYHDLDNIKQDDVEGVHQARNKFEKLRGNVKWWKDWRACNLWTSAFFFNYTEENKQSAPTSERLQKFLHNPEAAYGPMIGKANAIAIEHKFFHWSLEFPDVFNQGGFDVIIGNPPWEIVELNAKEYFKTRNSNIANAASDKIRKELIENLKKENNTEYTHFQNAKHFSDAHRKFIQESARFPSSSKGRIDLYPLFVENSMILIRDTGLINLIVPSEISTGAYNVDLFSEITNSKRLKSYFDFENVKKLFPDVDSRKRFSLLTISGTKRDYNSIDLLYFGHEINDLLNKDRRITLNFDDLELFSPNTLSPPILKNSTEYALAKKTYTRFGVFINKKAKSNLWNAAVKRMYSLSDSGIDFKKNTALTIEEKSSRVRMYSGKNIHQFNHRYASYFNGEISDSHPASLNNAEYEIETEYYVPNIDLLNKLNDKNPSRWLVGYRDVTNATNERTTISTIIPKVACDTNCRNIYSDQSAIKLALLVANCNSIVFDFFCRQKIIGLHLNAGTFEQLPILPPSVIVEPINKLLLPKTLELIYASWDIKAFADDVWREAGEEIKACIKKQWSENQAVTGGHDWNPPEWCEIENDGCPLPPFKWDGDRRAVLKAEMDAIYAKLYALTTEELHYILDPQDVYGRDFPGETFRVLKEKEIRQYGEYRTRRLVLEAWEKLNKETISLPTHFDRNMIDLSLHSGIYSIAETAAITGFSPQQVTSWFRELCKENYEGIDAKSAKDIEARRISFHGLIELVVIGTLRENGFPLKKILKARADLSLKTRGKVYPFATNNVKKNLKTSGRDIIWDFGDDVKVTLDGTDMLNINFMNSFFKDIIFDENTDLALRLIPAKGNHKVIIDPKVGLGKPVIIDKEVPVDTIAAFYDNNPQNMQILQDQYNLTKEEVLAAVAYMN